MPSTLPPSAIDPSPHQNQNQNPQSHDQPPQQAKYVVSPSGHAAHPTDIIASCSALQAHLAKMQADADKELREFEERRRERDLAEKRKVAPGWLDSEARLLEPEKKVEDVTRDMRRMSLEEGDGQVEKGEGGQTEKGEDEGAQLDRAFGGIKLDGQ